MLGPVMMGDEVRGVVQVQMFGMKRPFLIGQPPITACRPAMIRISPVSENDGLT